MIYTRDNATFSHFIPFQTLYMSLLLDYYQLSFSFYYNLKNNCENIWQFGKKCVPLHSLLRNTPLTRVLNDSGYRFAQPLKNEAEQTEKSSLKRFT